MSSQSSVWSYVLKLTCLLGLGRRKRDNLSDDQFLSEWMVLRFLPNMIIQEYLMSVSTCRCRKEPRRLFFFRLNIWILRVSKKKWVLVLSVPWYFVYYWLTQCAGLWVCRELVKPDWALPSGQCRSLFIFHTFLYFEEKKPKKNYGIRGKNVIMKKMNSTSSLMGLGRTLWVPVISSCSPSLAHQWFSANALDLRS